MHFDVAGALHDGGCFQREAEVLVLNLRNGDGGTDCGVEQAGGADAVDRDASERGGLGWRSGGIGGGGDWVAFSDAEDGRLPVADSNLNVVQSTGIAGVKRE